MDKKSKNDYPNETTNTFAGITTPSDQQNIAATDSISEFVEEAMDNLQATFDPEAKKKREQERVPLQNKKE
ncbi:hypothetical protein J31TS4_02830 [Paenibacillus sp. J31TS4]|uniref:hypothetical protein n=1 Tax=Paenibacillus sp. J31TS4 TaxID=2807195 RepID=UPI001B25C2B9|nr:hypothetical protein [Paenibacillus sp. J31TS4]GIP37003.1 hypothetical protein J31TS4_02830 [Paenibacillus sp. J31TS4]